MLLNLKHKELEVFKRSMLLLNESYRLTDFFPDGERFTLVKQLRRASSSVLLNIAEGSSRISLLERKRYFEIARGSVVEIDTGFTIALCLKFITEKDLEIVSGFLNDVFAMLSRMIKTLGILCK